MFSVLRLIRVYNLWPKCLPKVCTQVRHFDNLTQIVVTYPWQLNLETAKSQCEKYPHPHRLGSLPFAFILSGEKEGEKVRCDDQILSDTGRRLHQGVWNTGTKSDKIRNPFVSLKMMSRNPSHLSHYIYIYLAFPGFFFPTDATSDPVFLLDPVHWN